MGQSFYMFMNFSCFSNTYELCHIEKSVEMATHGDINSLSSSFWYAAILQACDEDLIWWIQHFNW